VIALEINDDGIVAVSAAGIGGLSDPGRSSKIYTHTAEFELKPADRVWERRETTGRYRANLAKGRKIGDSHVKRRRR
jgi:hypothetical protein